MPSLGERLRDTSSSLSVSLIVMRMFLYVPAGPTQLVNISKGVPLLVLPDILLPPTHSQSTGGGGTLGDSLGLLSGFGCVEGFVPGVFGFSSDFGGLYVKAAAMTNPTNIKMLKIANISAGVSTRFGAGKCLVITRRLGFALVADSSDADSIKITERKKKTRRELEKKLLK